MSIETIVSLTEQNGLSGREQRQIRLFQLTDADSRVKYSTGSPTTDRPKKNSPATLLNDINMSPK